MKTIQIEYQVYSFNELSEESKEKARDWYREGNDFSFHAEWVTDDSKEIAKIMGINIDKIYYSGFWSQGDGACFTGSYYYTENSPQKIKEYAPSDSKLYDIALLFDLCKGLSATIRHRGHYYHSGCMDISPISDSEEDTQKNEEILKDALTSFADWIYRRLEKEYEYQNSDEVVDESIIANEYEFLENGKVF